MAGILGAVKPAAVAGVSPGLIRFGSGWPLDALQHTAARPFILRRRGEDQSAELQRKLHPPGACLAHRELHRHGTGSANGSARLRQPASHDDRFEDRLWFHREARKPLLEPQQIDKVPVAKPRHGHQASAVILQIQQRRRDFDHARP